MPDRPGALGAVASRIGAVRADVVGIEILTRSDGRVMDEIVVDIDPDLLGLLLSEISEVDGVSVGEVRTLPGKLRDRRLDAYSTATALLVARTPAELLAALAERVSDELDAKWVAVLDTETELLLAAAGGPPGSDWLAATYRRDTGRRATQTVASGSTETRPRDSLWATLARFDAAIGAGRPDWSFSDHEQEKLETIARLADARWSELGSQTTRAAGS
jgi:hypothetical protein